MPSEFRPHEPDQTLLSPSLLRDWLPEGHSAFFLPEPIDALDPCATDMHHGDTGPGNEAIVSRKKLKVLVYTHATGWLAKANRADGAVSI